MRTEALVCTDTETDPIQMIQWYLRRWRIEVTFQEVVAHLGVETQRQWSDRAIARTTPLLLGLFSWITLAAGLMQQENSAHPHSCAWYDKCEPTFSDSIALVRRHLWLASGSLYRHRGPSLMWRKFLCICSTDSLTRLPMRLERPPA